MRSHFALTLSLLGLGCGASVTSNATDASDVPVAFIDDPAPPVDVPVVAVDVPPVMVEDVPVVTPEDIPVVTGDLEIGAPCMRDSECQSGLCANTPGVVAGCAQPCTIDDDCVGAQCVLDRNPAGGRMACGQVVTAVVDAVGACTMDTECTWGLCLDGLCHNPCADDTYCLAGWHCGPQAIGARNVQVCRANPITGVTVEDFTLVDGPVLVDRLTMPTSVVAPPDTVSLTWVTQDVGGGNLFASVSNVTSPVGTALVDLRSWNTLREQPVRTIPQRLEINTATFPGRDMEPMVPGVFTSTHLLQNDRMGTAVTSRNMRALVRIKRAPGGVAANGWTLRIAIVMGGVPGLNTTTAPTNTRLQNAINRMRTIYATMGINIMIAGYGELTAADAARFGTIDSQEELRALFQESAGATPDVLPIFIVRGIATNAGLENAIGIAGGINGPPGIQGTVSSGVVASWDNSSGRVDLLGQVLAHECGHYLGLWHVRERLAACTAAGQMDCSIFGGVDNITDTPTGTTASQYLMFWTTDGTNNRLTDGQGLMMRRNPMVH